MLCSVATMIHDSYLPLFMRHELGMTNTVRTPLPHLTTLAHVYCTLRTIGSDLALAVAPQGTQESCSSAMLLPMRRNVFHPLAREPQ